MPKPGSALGCSSESLGSIRSHIRAGRGELVCLAFAMVLVLVLALALMAL